VAVRLGDPFTHGGRRRLRTEAQRIPREQQWNEDRNEELLGVALHVAAPAGPSRRSVISLFARDWDGQMPGKPATPETPGRAAHYTFSAAVAVLASPRAAL